MREEEGYKIYIKNMIGKIGSKLASARHFGIVQASMARVLNTVDRSTQAYSRSKYDPSRPLEVRGGFKRQGHEAIVREAEELKMEATYVSNGFTVVSENSHFPSNVNMGRAQELIGRDCAERGNA